MNPFEIILGAGLATIVLKSMKEKGIDPESKYISDEQLRVAQQAKSPVSETVAIARALTESPVAPSTAPTTYPSPTAAPSAMVAQQASSQAPIVSSQRAPLMTASLDRPKAAVIDITPRLVNRTVRPSTITSSKLGEPMPSSNRKRLADRRGTDFTIIDSTPTEQSITEANVEYYPDKAVVNSVSVEHQVLSNEINKQSGELIPAADAASPNLESSIQSSASTAAKFVTDAQTDLTAPAQGVLAKFNQLETPAKLMVLGAGYFAVKHLPSKYLYMAAGLLAYSQMKKSQAVASHDPDPTGSGRVGSQREV